MNIIASLALLGPFSKMFVLVDQLSSCGNEDKSLICTFIFILFLNPPFYLSIFFMEHGCLEYRTVVFFSKLRTLILAALVLIPNRLEILFQRGYLIDSDLLHRVPLLDFCGSRRVPREDEL